MYAISHLDSRPKYEIDKNISDDLKLHWEI
jgi:hypothetical protein